jgi:hypothetical protein
MADQVLPPPGGDPPMIDVRITEIPDRVTVEDETMKVARIGRAANLESARVRRAERVSHQMVFLFVLLLVAFVVVAYRSETNAADLRHANVTATAKAYSDCLIRVERVKAINPGRAALTELLLTLVASDQSLSPQQRADAATTLHDGLLVPIENCGKAP